MSSHLYLHWPGKMILFYQIENNNTYRIKHRLGHLGEFCGNSAFLDHDLIPIQSLVSGEENKKLIFLISLQNSI